MATTDVTLTIDPGASVQYNHVLGQYCQHGHHFENIKRLNSNISTDSVQLNKNDILNFYIDFNTANLDLDTSNKTYIEEVYLNSLVAFVYNNPLNTGEVGEDSLGMVKATDITEYFSITNVQNERVQPLGTGFSLSSSLNQETQLGSPLVISASNKIGSLTVSTSTTVNLELHMMGNLILKVHNSAASDSLYEWIGFNHDPRMIINPI